jgi:hypothetical protein
MEQSFFTSIQILKFSSLPLTHFTSTSDRKTLHVMKMRITSAKWFHPQQYSANISLFKYLHLTKVIIMAIYQFFLIFRRLTSTYDSNFNFLDHDM